MAGATDVGLWVTKQLRDIAPAVHIGRVRELRRIEETDDAITIGAGVTYDEAASVIAAHYADFGELIRRLIAELQARLAMQHDIDSAASDVTDARVRMDMDLALAKAGM